MINPRIWGLVLLAACLTGPARGAQDTAAPLVLEQTIPLGNVAGRIDHLAIDLDHRRLFVAGVGDGSVEAIDLASGRITARIGGLKEPQGLAYLPKSDELVVASGDGLVRFLHAGDLSVVAQLKLGDDADDVRFDSASGNVVVGYGAGGLAVIEPVSRKVIATLPLAAHPEGFSLDPIHHRVFVNLPDAGRIVVGDLLSSKLIDSRRAAHAANFPLVYDAAANTVIVVYRLPARLVVTNADTGAAVQDIDTCGDSDDLFIDAKRKRLYVSCGSGDLDVFDTSTTPYHRLARIKTTSGARTSLFVPELDRLFVAAKANGSQPAAIMVFRPGP